MTFSHKDRYIDIIEEIEEFLKEKFKFGKLSGDLKEKAEELASVIVESEYSDYCDMIYEYKRDDFPNI